MLRSMPPGERRLQLDSIAEEDHHDSALEPSGDLSPGMIVAGKFALVRLIARGEIAQVFEAEDTLIGRRVALKVLSDRFASEPDVVHRFRQEAQATALVAHPHVVAIFEIGRRMNGALYIVEELLNGPTLHEHRVQRGKLGEDEALRIITPIAGALATAHALGVIHRDVKPSNIVLANALFADTVPKLIDFGVARVQAGRGRGKTLVGTLLGTAHYMSPEQARGDVAIDGRTDAWALAVCLFELLTGTYPFDGESEHAVLARIVTGDAPRVEAALPNARPGLAALIQTALAFEANHRPTMRTLYLQLKELLGTALPLQLAPSDREQQAAESAVPSEVSSLDLAFDLPPVDLSKEEVHEPPVEDDDAMALGDDDIEVVDETDLDEVVEVHEKAWIRGTGEAGTEFSQGATASELPNRYVEAAQRALLVNALDEAVLHAEQGVVAAKARGETLGQLRLVQAIALYWLGSFDSARTHAEQAIEALPEGSTGWFGALGHWVMARERQGRIDTLAEVEARIANVPGELGSAQIVALSRLAVTMTNSGALVAARRLASSIRERMDRENVGEPVVYAWLDRAFAERARFVGDHARELARRTSALERFTAAGDVRNACHERAQLGAALLRIGAHDEAERALTDALGIAEPMKLFVVGTIKATLGFAAFRRGKAELAKRHLADAIALAVNGGDRQLEAAARCHLVLVHTLEKNDEAAISQSDIALELSQPFPALRAQALGVRAAALLFAARPHDALANVQQATRLIDHHGGAGEAESLIRLTHALALSQTGDDERAARRIRDARTRVLALAERLTEARHKRAFLERITENKRILELAEAWLANAAS